MKADEVIEKYKADRAKIKEFLEDSKKTPVKAAKLLKYLSLDLHDKNKQRECKELIKSGLIDKVALEEFLRFLPENPGSMAGGIDSERKLRQDIVKNALDELYKAEENVLHKQAQAVIKDVFVERQKEIGSQIKQGKSRGKGTMLGDLLTRIKNFRNLGYIPEEQKSERTKLIEEQKEIGRKIRSSNASVIPKFIRSTLGMIKKDGGRGH